MAVPSETCVKLNFCLSKGEMCNQNRTIFENSEMGESKQKRLQKIE